MGEVNVEIAGYKIKRVIGQGGMATIYLAIQKGFDREVAVKVMSEHLSTDPEFGERFLREAKIVSQLIHPNIVTVFEVGCDQGHHFLSMEYISGKDLKECITDLSLVDILKVIKEVSSALNFSGNKGYVHRDIKPENIMISDQDRRTVLMDFGIAKSTDNSKDLTQLGAAIGTPYYMSPEQAKGESVDWRSDIYSLGVVFFLLLTGKLPFDGDSAVTVVMKHVSDIVPPLPHYLQSTFTPIIDKLLAKNVNDRFQNGQEIIQSLNSLSLEDLDVLNQLFQNNRENIELNNTNIIPSATKSIVEHGETNTDTRIIQQDSKDITNSTNQSQLFKKTLSLLILLSFVSFFFYYLLYEKPSPIKQSTEVTVNIDNTLKATSDSSPNQDATKKEPDSTIIAKSDTSPYRAVIKKESNSILTSQIQQLIVDINQNMIMISGDTFKMGIKKVGMTDARPVHKVQLDSFYLSKFEVTQLQYNTFLQATTKDEKSRALVKLPITQISWIDTQKFITWLNSVTQTKYRLPTEAEWEFSAKSNTLTNYPWGNGIGSNNANCKGCSVQKQAETPTLVGTFKPNGLGIYDMQGNVWEWTQDCYKKNYKGTPTNGSAYIYKQCQRRVLRGGAFNSQPKELYSSYRNAAKPDHKSKTIGFRLAKNK